MKIIDIIIDALCRCPELVARLFCEVRSGRVRDVVLRGLQLGVSFYRCYCWK